MAFSDRRRKTRGTNSSPERATPLQASSTLQCTAAHRPHSEGNNIFSGTLTLHSGNVNDVHGKHTTKTSPQTYYFTLKSGLGRIKNDMIRLRTGVEALSKSRQRCSWMKVSRNNLVANVLYIYNERVK